MVRFSTDEAPAGGASLGTFPMVSSAAMRTRLLLLLAAASLAACSKPAADDKGATPAQEAKAEAFGRLTIDDLQSKMDQAKDGKVKLAIYDNNSKERFAKGHIPTAKWVKFDQIQATDLPADKETTLVFYCGGEQCTACHTGAKQALSLGYKNVFIYSGGIKGWETAQKPLETA